MKKIFGFIALALLGMASRSAAQNVNVCAGDSVILVCNVIGGTYQWQESPDGITFTNINGATNPTFGALPPSGFYYIRAEVTTACGPVYSDTIPVRVGSLPIADAGTDYSGTCLDTIGGAGGGPSGSGGTGALTYAWTTNGTNHLSATNVPYPTINGIYNDQLYILTVTDSIGCVSAPDTFQVTENPFVVSFTFTGAMQTFTPNPCFSGDTMLIQCWGAQGGAGANGGNSSAGGSGGLGGYADGYVVTTNQVFNVFVGGQGATPTGGFNGGANGGSQNAGGGGGASDVRINGITVSDRVVVGGGGGGGGRGGCDLALVTGGNGGSGGGGIGANGTDAPTPNSAPTGVAGGGKGGNFGGTQGLNGPAGIGCSGFLGSPGTVSVNEVGGPGGAGQTCCCFGSYSVPGGGGGGGGFLGGGGGGGGSAGTTGCAGNDKGGGGGGGGGSSYIGGVTNGSTNSGIWLGNGMVTLTINP